MTVQDVANEMEELAGHTMDVCSDEGGKTDRLKFALSPS